MADIKVQREILERLIEISRDAQTGFREFAERISDPEVKIFFQEKSLERANFAGELESELHRLGESDVEQSGTVAGTVGLSKLLSWFDAHVIDGLVNLVRHITVFPLGHGSNLFDKYVVDGLVNGVANTASGASRFFRRMQSGFVQNYALVMGAGIVLITVVYLFTKP